MSCFLFCLFHLGFEWENVTVECEDGTNLIRRYDCDRAFHFVDPPYVGSDCGHYNGTFNEEDFQHLLDTLAKVKGKFMLTMFPHRLIEQYVRECGWHIYRIERTITASKVSRRRQEEWITTNY